MENSNWDVWVRHCKLLKSLSIFLINLNLFAEYVWRCQLRQYVVKVSAVMLGIMSVAIVMGEATLTIEADLSLFSLLLRNTYSEILMEVSSNSFDLFAKTLRCCLCKFWIRELGSSVALSHKSCYFWSDNCMWLQLTIVVVSNRVVFSL